MVLTLLSALPFLQAAGEDYAAFVDPFVGTTATGHTTPAAAYPFGMVQAGPTTGLCNWQYCSGYRYEDTSVTGYALTALSGTGMCEYNELQVLPFSGATRPLPMKSAIDKATERAEPGYYAVRQPEDGVRVEIAAAKRAAIYRFRWEKGRTARVLVNLPYGNGPSNPKFPVRSCDGKVTRFGEGRIEGEHFRTGSIARRRIAFAFLFDHPWKDCEELPKKEPGELPRYVLTFDLPDGEALLMKCAFSTQSPEGARRNLDTSAPTWDFDRVRVKARAVWNELLSRSTCEGTEEQKRNWYTSLYHLYFQPNDYSDEGDAEPFYTTMSIWDTFRAAHPWYTIVAPEVARDAVLSCLRHFRLYGRLPVLSYGGKIYDCMIGNHAVPVVVDACLKGICPWSEDAYAAVTNTLTVAHRDNPKENWDVYDRYGYYPHDVINGEGVSRTMECSYDDWCASLMAKAMGHEADVAFFRKRADSWKNVFDPASGFARGKSAAGAWRAPFDPYAFGHGSGRDNDFTEGNAFQYSWHVLHDVDGLFAAMGGREAALKKLESLFVANETTGGAPPDVTGLIGQYVHGNEPSHHVIYLFTLLGRPDLTARYVREVCDRFYRPKPDGLCGNDDCGQMSAWYVFSALGFYPVNPCGGEYVLGAPQLPKVTLRVKSPSRESKSKSGSGNALSSTSTSNFDSFTVIARNLSKENKYVKSVTLNGKPVTGWKLRHADILAGGELVFEMAADGFRLRDPFVLTDAKTRTYYLYGAEHYLGETNETTGVWVRRSSDLKTWSAPVRAMTAPKGIQCVWAPEVHAYGGAYYMFATLKEYPDAKRPLVMMGPTPDWSSKLGGLLKSWHATWIFRAERPEGPSRPVSGRPVTPPGWIALDGTLGVEDDKPYLVFTHDWAQVADGTVELAPLTDDLSALAGPPKTLFRASVIAPGTLKGVTDGPFVYRSPKSGKLFVTWSTHNPPKLKRKERGYCVVSSESASGRLEGPWVNHRIIYDANGGHGMVFRTFEGDLKFALHNPEIWGSERLAIYDFIDDGEKIEIRAF